VRERDIEAYLVKRVQAMGGEVRKVQWIGRRGAPDRFVLLPARVVGPLYPPGQTVAPARAIWVELKAPGVGAEQYQLREHARLRAMGQRVEVVDSLQGVEELLG
jgi:hypothetical protein